MCTSSYDLRVNKIEVRLIDHCTVQVQRAHKYTWKRKQRKKHKIAILGKCWGNHTRSRVWRCGKIRFLSIMARTDHLRAPSRNEKLQDAQACMMRDRDIRVRRNSKRIFGSLILSSTAGARDSFQRGWRSFEASKLRSLYPFRNALLSQQSTAITSKKATHTSAAGLFIIYKAKTKSIPFLCNEFVIFRHAIM